MITYKWLIKQINLHIFNRPSVVRAVLEKALLLINSLINLLIPCYNILKIPSLPKLKIVCYQQGYPVYFLLFTLFFLYWCFYLQGCSTDTSFTHSLLGFNVGDFHHFTLLYADELLFFYGKQEDTLSLIENT